MTVSHLFVMDPLENIDPDHDTTFAILQETETRQIETWICQSRDIELVRSSSSVKADLVTLKVDGEDYFRIRESRQLNLSDFDLIWMREDPPFDLNYLHATYLLDQVAPPVVNSPEGLRNSNEKLLTLEFPDLLPPTWVGSDPERAGEFIRSIGGDAVLKSLEGYGGEDVYRITDKKPENSKKIIELTNDGSTPVMVQKFLPEVLEDGDRRVILLGGEPIGALTRNPADGDFRSNFHSGGTAGEGGVRSIEKKVSKELKPLLVDRGLHLVGLDMIGDVITEINVTSPTCVQEINEVSDQSLQSQIVDYVTNLYP